MYYFLQPIIQHCICIINVVFPLIKYFQEKPKLINKFINIQGTYELVARNKEGEEQAQIVELTEEQVKLSLQAQDESAEKKGTIHK